MRATQTELLWETLKKNAHTEFGNRHQFQSINSIDEYRERTPIIEWGDVSPWIDRVAEGHPRVLTREAVSVLEPTGGSTSARKLIPYTADLQRQFQRAIRVWIHDLFTKRPALKRGRSYWSISPLANRPETSKGGIRIGFETDSAYLSSAEQCLLLGTLAVPPSVAGCATVEAAQFATMFHLLNAADLSLVSVWSPTFLICLLDFFTTHAERLCDSLRDGKLHVPTQWGKIPDAVQASIRQSVHRGDHTRACLRECSEMPELIQALWPKLGLISCWADGPSAYFANDLQNKVGPIEIQGKGLLATEAFVTIPLVDERAPTLAVRSHFFEFLPTGSPSSSATLLADELEVDQRYEMVVTTGGGLYRYRLRDEVQVVGLKREVPLLRFVGRSDQTMDMVGEKLDAAHIQSVLDRTFAEFAMTPTFVEVIPRKNPHCHYELLVNDSNLTEGHVNEDRFMQTLEEGLSENPAYAYARQIKQLHALRVTCIDAEESQQRQQESFESALSAGARLGDVKPRICSFVGSVRY